MYSGLDKNKQNEDNLLTSLKTWEQNYKELEEKYRVQEDERSKIKEKIAIQQIKCKEFKAELDTVIETLRIDADVSSYLTTYVCLVTIAQMDA